MVSRRELIEVKVMHYVNSPGRDPIRRRTIRMGEDWSPEGQGDYQGGHGRFEVNQTEFTVGLIVSDPI